MKHIRPFKEEFTFEERVQESKEIVAKYPDRVPILKKIAHISKEYGSILLDVVKILKKVAYSYKESHGWIQKVIVERFSRSDLPEMEKKKFLVPRDMSVGQFIHVLSRRLHLASGKALFVFVNNTLPQTAAIMDSLYESYKDGDGFLYMCYSSEKTFG